MVCWSILFWFDEHSMIASSLPNFFERKGYFTRPISHSNFAHPFFTIYILTFHYENLPISNFAFCYVFKRHGEQTEFKTQSKIALKNRTCK
jgi:hypothetical protein